MATELLPRTVAELNQRTEDYIQAYGLGGFLINLGEMADERLAFTSEEFAQVAYISHVEGPEQATLWENAILQSKLDAIHAASE